MTTASGHTHSRAEAESLDAEDPIASLRERFLFTDPNRIYLDGNSLGMLPKATAEAVRATIDQWGRDVILGWRRWAHLSEEIGDLIAQHVVEATPGEIVVSDSTSVNIYKLASAAISARPGRNVIVTDDDNFPTDQYVLQGLASERGMSVRLVKSDVDGIDVNRVAEAVGPDTALVMFSHVAYRTAAVADMHQITNVVHGAGALMLWDVSHAAGSVPVPLESSGADMAVGCTYKYINGGPGSPAFLYVRRGHPELRPPIWGWYGHSDQFEMSATFVPADGIERFLVGAPPILSMIGIEHGARLIGEAGVSNLRAKGIALTEFLISLADEWLSPQEYSIASPRRRELRGSHVSLRHERAKDIVRALIKKAGVVTDYRPPDVVRLAPAPLTTRFVDVWDAMDRLRAVTLD